MASTGNTGEYDHLVKLLMLGDSAVGKSSLLGRFCEGRFDANFVLTIGVDFKWKTVDRNNRKLKLQVWDTAGQERFRTITPAYYRSAMGVVITYDICEEETFKSVEYWITQLGQHGNEDVQRILVGNKSDLAANRKVSRQDGEALATKFGMAFFETSAKTGDKVDEAFLHIADNVVANRYANAPAPKQVDINPKKKGGCAC
mmetsp:Transcript_7134/g.11567  ORF Transcript_7134/g.11567 Transcript_7134/m.11567 type:complete len:201 (-) Transcript_7134:118-720(-)